MSSIYAGTYTVRDILQAAEFDFQKLAAADYNNGEPDHRRVQVGGLPFDSLDDVIVIPVTADEVVVTLDGSPSVTLEVELDDNQKQLRAYSFETAADANDPKVAE